MKCLFVDGVKQVSLRECDIPQLGDKDILVKIEARGICGTDLNSYRTGHAMGFGHEMSGTITEKGKDSPLKIGTHVFVSNLSAMNLASYAPDRYFSYMGGFAEYIVVRNAEEGRDVYTLPEGMSFAEGALVEPFCVSMSGVKKAVLGPDSKVVIIGAGIIGMLALEYLKKIGVKEVVVADINEKRLAKAEAAGAIPFNSRNGGLNEFLTERFGRAYSQTGAANGADVYIDAAGVASLLSDVVNTAKYGAQIIVLAVHHRPVEVNMMSVMYNNIQIKGSVMFSPRDISEAIDILSKDHSIKERIVSHEIPFDDAVEAFRTADDADMSLKVMMVG